MAKRDFGIVEAEPALRFMLEKDEGDINLIAVTDEGDRYVVCYISSDTGKLTLQATLPDDIGLEVKDDKIVVDEDC